MSKLTVYTTYYYEKNCERKSEILQCFKANCDNTYINKIVVFSESPVCKDIRFSDKINEINITERPNYSDYFRIINDLACQNTINIIANSDIFFKEGIAVVKSFNFENKCMALSRWDIQPDGSAKLFNRNDSQDVWIFKGKIKEGVFGDFPVGVPFCDNRIMYELQKAGYKVLNPAFSIKAYHLHAGKREEYKKENLSLYVDPPYRYRYPHNLYSLPRTLWFNLTHRHKLGKYRYDLKKVNRWFITKVVRRIWEFSTGRQFTLIGYKVKSEE